MNKRKRQKQLKFKREENKLRINQKKQEKKKGRLKNTTKAEI